MQIPREKLEKLPTDVLNQLGQAIYDIIKSRNAQTVKHRANTYTVGDIVSYESKKLGRTVTGKILDIRRTRCLIEDEESGKRLVVPMSMLPESGNVPKPVVAKKYSDIPQF